MRKEERIDATVGLQIAQPSPPRPKRASTESKSSKLVRRTAPASSAREKSKCSHSALETVRPIFFICCSRVFCSIGTQEPHWAPAVVQDFREATSWLPATIALADSTEADVAAGTQDCVVGQFGVGDANRRRQLRSGKTFGSAGSSRQSRGLRESKERCHRRTRHRAGSLHRRWSQSSGTLRTACGVCEQNLEATFRWCGGHRSQPPERRRTSVWLRCRTLQPELLRCR